MKTIKQMSCYLVAALMIFMAGCTVTQEIEEEEDPIPQEEVVIEEEITPAKGGNLTVAIRNPKTLNPLYNEDHSIDQILRLVFEPLITLDDTLKPVPNLAESWEMSQNGTTLIVNLRRGITWHDGTPVTAKDVVFSMETIQKSGETSIYKRCVQNVSQYTEIDAHTVRITYNQPFSGALYALYFPIIPEHYYRGETMSSSAKNMQPVGNGAYRFESFTPMKTLLLQANENWFKGATYIDTITAMVTPDKETDLYAFDQKQLDVAITDVVDWEKYSEMGETETYEYMTNYYDFIGLNFNHSLFQDKRLRQAIAYSIPKERIINEQYLGHAVAAKTPINPNSWLYEAEGNEYTYHAETSKALLAQAGWEDSDEDGILDQVIDGMKQDLSFHMMVNKENMERVQAAYEIQTELQEIGIQLIIEEVEFDTYTSRLETRDFESFMGGWRLSLIPDLTFAFHTSQAETGTNYISYRSQEMDNLLQQAFLAQGDSGMKKAYKDLQQYIAEELPYISLYFRTSAVLTSNRVRGNVQPTMDSIYGNIQEWFIYERKTNE